MARSTIGEITSYQQCHDRLHTPSERTMRVLCSNTRLYRVIMPDKSVSYTIAYYESTVVTYHQDGVIILNTGGRRSVTTKERLKRFSPAYVYQKKFEWYIGLLPFFDGMNVGRPRHLGDVVCRCLIKGCAEWLPLREYFFGGTLVSSYVSHPQIPLVQRIAREAFDDDPASLAALFDLLTEIMETPNAAASLT